MNTVNYQQQAQDFLTKTNTTFKAEFVKFDKHFDDDEYGRDIYTITLKRGDRVYAFSFGQSLKDSSRYYDTVTKRIFSPSGQGLNCNVKVTSDTFFKNHCQLIKGEEPTAYDVLACLTKYEVGTFEDFCSDFGYDTDSRRAEKIYKAVCDEWMNVQRLFTDEEIEQLREIQ